MLIEPGDIDSSAVAAHVQAGWNIDVNQGEYAPVGFGSHHWVLHGSEDRRWFATVDDLRMGDRDRATLDGALAAAFRLQQSGLDFVVGPLARPDGALTHAITPHYVLAVYPYVKGQAYSYGRYQSQTVRRTVIERLATIHQSTELVREIAPVDDLTIPKRSSLESTLSTIADPWQSGPFADEARALLIEKAGALWEALAHYDQLADQVRSTREAWVITHGEPHRGNTMVSDSGLQLIDWETARIAPAERDLWTLIDENHQSQADYTELTGRRVHSVALAVYRQWWNLCEVALFTADLRTRHEDTPETQIALTGLREHLALATSASRVDD